MEFRNEICAKVMYLDYVIRISNLFLKTKITDVLPYLHEFNFITEKKYFFGLIKKEKLEHKKFNNLDDMINYIYFLDENIRQHYLMNFEKWFNNNFTNEIKLY